MARIGRKQKIQQELFDALRELFIADKSKELSPEDKRAVEVFDVRLPNSEIGAYSWGRPPGIYDIGFSNTEKWQDVLLTPVRAPDGDNYKESVEFYWANISLRTHRSPFLIFGYERQFSLSRNYKGIMNRFKSEFDVDKTEYLHSVITNTYGHGAQGSDTCNLESWCMTIKVPRIVEMDSHGQIYVVPAQNRAKQMYERIQLAYSIILVNEAMSRAGILPVQRQGFRSE